MRDGSARRVALSSYRFSINPSCRLNWRPIRPVYQSHHRPAFSTSSRTLAAATPVQQKEVDIGIVGGGLSGLCTAFYILAWHQRAFTGQPPKITIYEGSNRVGGWIQTTKVGKGKQQWNFEHGPRTLRLRPESMILQLLQTLGLEEQIHFTSRQEPAAQNRYLYRGGNRVDELFKVPNRLIPGSYEDAWQLLTFIAPILRHVPGAIFSKFPDRDKIFENQRPGEEDISLGEFMSWIVGREFVDQTMSAMIHGIYGADIYSLSAREVFADKTNLVDLYANGYITGVRDAWFGRGVEMYPDGPSGVYAPPGEPFFKTLVDSDRIGIPSADFKVLAGQILDPTDSSWGQFRAIGPGSPRAGGSYLNDLARRSAFATIEGGLQTLIDSLARVLTMSGVNIQMNTKVAGLEPAKGKVTVRTTSSKEEDLSSISHDYVVSTLDPHHLSEVNITSPKFAEISPSLTLGVTTMVFERSAKSDVDNPNPEAFYGTAQSSFGYLIPSSYSNPKTNPNGALGVVFDSGSSAITKEPLFAQLEEQQKKGGQPSYAKLTVMAGGEYYDGVRDPRSGEKIHKGSMKSQIDGINQEQTEVSQLEPTQTEGEQVGSKSNENLEQNKQTLEDEGGVILPVLATDTIWRQLGVPPSKDPVYLKVLSKHVVGSDTVCSRLAKNAIVQHGVGHLAQYNEESAKLEQKFGKGRVILSGRAAHGNGITQCVDGAVSTAARVLMEGYGISKVEEIVRRIRTPPG